jgi:hypothetical protein
VAARSQLPAGRIRAVLPDSWRLEFQRGRGECFGSYKCSQLLNLTTELQPDTLAQAPSAEDVRAQWERILASDGFVLSTRLCRFLRFTVEHKLRN